jgi:hypothetical protein
MAYAEATELARVLQIRSPSDEQTAALERKLDVATGEIDREIDLDADATLSVEDQATLEDVCLRRAAELWQLDYNALGVIGADMGPTYLTKNSWEKYANELAHVKGQWGLA